MSSHAWVSETFGQICPRVGLALLLIASLPGVGRAQEPCAPDVQVRRAAVTYEGHEGLWFDLAVARCLLQQTRLVPELQLEVQLYEQRAIAASSLEALLRRQLVLAGQESDTARASLDAAVAARDEAISARDAWYRSPILWTVVGMAISGALVALSAYALNQSR